MKFVLAAAVAAVGLVWLHARHDAQAAERQLWGTIATELAGRPVSVHCQGFISAQVDVTAELGTVSFDGDGRPADHTDLKRDVCAALTRYPRDRTLRRFQCVVQNVPCDTKTFMDVEAVHALAHESAHLAGQESESATECRALQTTAYIATRLGSPIAEAQTVAAYAYKHIYPQLPDAYHSGCAPY